MRPILLTLSLLLATALNAGELACGTSSENDRRALALHERTRARLASLAADPSRAANLREGAFYLQTDETITPGYRSFDLDGQSLVFTPAGNDRFVLRREALQYTEPAGEPVRDFQSASGADWHYVPHDLPFALPLFGTTTTRLYVSAFNGIHTKPPVEQMGTEFDAIEAAVHRDPVLSPLMITANKPPELVYPRVWIDQQPGAVIVTWRSSANAPFGYDVQAKLTSDGTITYSYRSLVAMRWGTPILSRGFDPAGMTRATLESKEDPQDSPGAVPAAVRAMLDVRRVDVQRLSGSELFAVRVTLGGPIDRTKIAEGDVLGIDAAIGLTRASVRFDRNNTYVRSFSGQRFDVDGASVHVAGNVVEFYGVQRDLTDEWTEVATRLGAVGLDSVTTRTVFTAGASLVTVDLSTAAQNGEVHLPIAEPFVLGELDVFRVWDLARTSYGLSAWEHDAVAIYETFFTGIIDRRVYASSTGGNSQVTGIAPVLPFTGPNYARAPILMEMNQLGFGRSKTPEGAARVLLHEFGHRWLYRFRIRENGVNTSALNPVSSHPAAYVHTPAAFPLYGENESSVMGGAYFTPMGDGSYQAHAANVGYSWTDLYLMGLAAPEEVPPWFYLAGTVLPREYYAEEGAIARGEKRDVNVGQIVAVHGPRIPSIALSQRQFRVLFVLVTENAEPTDAEVAKLNEWRALMERNFALATGGRGKLVTTFVRPGKRRAS
jgi:hypothetical protein